MIICNKISRTFVKYIDGKVCRSKREVIIMNCFMGNNFYLYLLIIMLILCCNGCLNDIVGKICECWYLIPIVVLLLCCCNKGQGHGNKGIGGNYGCGCK